MRHTILGYAMGQAMPQTVDQSIGFLALGANLPTHDRHPRATLTAAMTQIEQEMTVLDCSRIFRTPCFPAGAGPDYVNAAIKIEYRGESVELLHHLHKIEAAFGRLRNGRWASRSLDIDLLFHGNRVAPTKMQFEHWQLLPLEQQMVQTPQQLILPHPRIQDRAFVLGPMMDIAPNWVHPVLGQKIHEMWDMLPAQDRAAIQAI